MTKELSHEQSGRLGKTPNFKNTEVSERMATIFANGEKCKCFSI
jgi:hypothetical protein